MGCGVWGVCVGGGGCRRGRRTLVIMERVYYIHTAEEAGRLHNELSSWPISGLRDRETTTSVCVGGGERGEGALGRGEGVSVCVCVCVCVGVRCQCVCGGVVVVVVSVCVCVCV